MEQDVRKACQALVEVRREMKPLFEFPDDGTEAKKEDWKQKLLEYKEILKAEIAYKVFRCFIVGNL
jgi:hypothetical protein